MNEIKFREPKYPELEAVLARNGLFYKDIAEYLGIGVSPFTERMRGKTEFKINEIERILKLFDMTFEELFKHS